MKTTLMIAAVLAASATAWAASPAAPNSTGTPTGCHASLTVADARTLVTAIPNARAFVDDFGATLETSVRSQDATAAKIAITARDPRHGETEVGVYTVSLRTGNVTDDDMEPADDDGTAAVRNKLIARHCAAK